MFQEGRPRPEVVGLESTENMFLTKEVFQEDRSRLEIWEFLNIEDMFVTEEVLQEDTLGDNMGNRPAIENLN